MQRSTLYLQILLCCSCSKIIGAKYYKTDGFKIKDLKSPRDIDDHGTHIASTAAGNRVSMASMLGLGQGTSRGGATLTCIAVYKACWNDHCDDADILAAFDDAIADGVDILSVSLGGSNDQNYFGDASSIGAFHAMKNGIVTLFAAGNSSPSPASVDNLYPWSISVVASTLDKICWSPEQAIGVMSCRILGVIPFLSLLYVCACTHTHTQINRYIYIQVGNPLVQPVYFAKLYYIY